MYGDTSVVRALARGMRERAGDIRTEADELAARSEAVAWSGLAADAMRRLARAHAARLESCADAHDAAADALDRHAREVDHLEELIAAIEHRALRIVASAASGVAGFLGHVLPDGVEHGVEHWVEHFDPPPPGNRAWLDVHLPCGGGAV